MRLVRFLTILAMLFAPLGMVGEHAAMAMPAAADAPAHHAESAAPAAHCADMTAQAGDESDLGKDCMTDCAIACSAVPAFVGGIALHEPLAAMIEPQPLARGLRGLHPESDPPPPRNA